MTDRFDRDPVADALRASLAAHAQEAPKGDLLAERIISAADRQPGRAEQPGRRTWRTWALPLVAAGAVAAVVGAVAGIENWYPHASRTPVANSPSPHLPTPTPAPHSRTPSPSTLASRSTAPVNTAALHGVRILDLTFAGQDDGWALASADCIRTAGRCTALLRTTDGTTWKSMPGSEFNVPGVSAGCATRCVQHIRFANDSVGYAYGPHALLMTTDGGFTWEPQPGGALFLESLQGNVIRVTASSDSGCPGPCGVRVETSAIGSTTWAPAALGPVSGARIAFARGGPNAYLLVMRNPAGGASDATSTLYRSADRGVTWTSSGEPCPQAGGEVDSFAVAGGGGNEVSVLCTVRMAPHRSFVATSSDGGAYFAAQPGTVPAATAEQLTGDPTTVLVAAGDGLARSADGGRHWTTVPEVTGHITFVGFENRSVGRAVTDGNAIWTTRDAGESWTQAAFG